MAEAPPTRREALTPTRRVIARRMTESWKAVPQVTLTRSVGLVGILAEREELMRSTGRRLPFDALLAHRVALALRGFELLAGSFDEGSMSVDLPDRLDIGVAVDAPAGLTVVVLRSADERRAADLAAELQTLVERARAGRSRIDDLTGARFTITNLGGLGIDAFTPIVPAPQAAILGVGAYQREAVDPRAVLSLSFDHRVADGAYAARFLARLADDLAGSHPTAEGTGGARG